MRKRDTQKLQAAEMRLLRSVKGRTRLDKTRNEDIRKELGVFSFNDRIRRYRQDWLNTWKGWKKDECRSRLFGTGPKEEEILVDHAEGGIH
jgi:hypothetical protein